jgi:uncharacterized protein YndB with AHSA1/START domain
MNEGTTVATADREVRITRTFDAPCELVFKAWTDPDQVAQWWGPEGFDVPRSTVTIDVRVGGRYDLCMVEAATGAEFWVRSTIAELVEPELIVLTSEAQPEYGLVETITRVQFHDHGDKTRMTLNSGPYTEDMAGNSETGWSMSFDKLDRRLAG